MEQNNLLNEFWSAFSAGGKTEWESLVRSELGEKGLAALSSTSGEGIITQPFYDEQDLKQLKDQEAFTLKSNSNLDQPEAKHWNNLSHIRITDEKSANKQALLDLNQGADGVIFNLDEIESIDFHILLNQIRPEFCQIVFESEKPRYELVKQYFTILENLEINPELISGWYSFNPVNWAMMKNKSLDSLAKDFQNLHTAAFKYPFFKTLMIGNGFYRNQGAKSVLSSACLLGEFVEIIRQWGTSTISLKELFKNLIIEYSMDSHFFSEIAHLKALRFLVPALAREIEKSEEYDEHLQMHTVISDWSQTWLGSDNNLIRNTLMALSSTIGGANSIHIPSHDSLLFPENKNSRRIGLNISNILKDESYLDKVIDPSKGAYYIETLTSQTAEKIWQKFGELEAEGGIIHKYQSRQLSKQLLNDREEQWEDLAKGTLVRIGVNRFSQPFSASNIPALTDFIKNSNTTRLTQQFELIIASNLIHAHKATEQGEKLVSVVGMKGDKRMSKISSLLSCLSFNIAEYRIESQNTDQFNLGAVVVLISPEDPAISENAETYFQSLDLQNKEIVSCCIGSGTNIEYADFHFPADFNIIYLARILLEQLEIPILEKEVYS